MSINRREWIQKSLLATSTLMFPPMLFGYSQIESEMDQEFLRMHWNENPFGPPDSVKKAVTNVVDQGNLYWDEKLDVLKSTLGKHHGLSNDHFFITSGSTEVLTLLGQHVGLLKGEILTPWPSFPTMLMFGERCGASVKRVDLKDYRINFEALRSEITSNTRLIFICNPNNPTSTEVNREELVQFIDRTPEDIIIAVDEAYIEFSEMGQKGSVVDRVKYHPNLIVCRTFSKAYGLAGFRLGYAISQAHNIKAIERRYPALGMAPGLLPAVAATVAIDDDAFVHHVVSQTNLGKTKMYKAFDQWGVEYARSSTNFIYARDNRFVRDFRSRLRNSNILITKWSTMTDHIRISIGKPEWVDQFITIANGLRI